uniref:Uncharacterized protein n=1 Tax=Lotus japonicus TaxID=34305 RepID=I3SZK9_LOTJA|nr:unknown [Lotus japonicus]
MPNLSATKTCHIFVTNWLPSSNSSRWFVRS